MNEQISKEQFIINQQNQEIANLRTELLSVIYDLNKMLQKNSVLEKEETDN